METQPLSSVWGNLFLSSKPGRWVQTPDPTHIHYSMGQYLAPWNSLWVLGTGSSLPTTPRAHLRINSSAAVGEALRNRPGVIQGQPALGTATEMVLTQCSQSMASESRPVSVREEPRMCACVCVRVRVCRHMCPSESVCPCSKQVLPPTNVLVFSELSLARLAHPHESLGSATPLGMRG